MLVGYLDVFWLLIGVDFYEPPWNLIGIFTNESGINLLTYLKGEIFEVLVAEVLVKIFVVPRVLWGPNPIEALLSGKSSNY